MTWKQSLREENLVFTNGCFDLLHPGHVALLEFCSTLGSVVVGLNSDDSVRKLKGPERPVWDQNRRKSELAGLPTVSEVIVFDEETPDRLIRSLKPRFIVKGSDYRPSEVAGGQMAQVVIFPRVEGYSTTLEIEKLRRGLQDG